MKIIDEPRYVAETCYEEAIGRMVDRLSSIPGVISVYQIGGVSVPGVSDVDMVVVFEDGALCTTDPKSGLSREERYLFVHDLFGASRKHFQRGQQYSLFHNYRLLFGEQLPTSGTSLGPQEEQLLKTQVALEYIVRMLVNMTVERAYGVLKLRSLLLQGNGLGYDLDFLNVTEGPLHQCVQRLGEWRAEWFRRRPDNGEVVEWVERCSRELVAFMRQYLRRCSFFLPPASDYRLGRNIRIRPADDVGISHCGFVFPKVLGGLGRRYVNLQHRVNQFSFGLPISTEGIPDVLERMFHFSQESRAYNERHLPAFMALTSSLVLN
jgi:hypothetical protein